MNTTFRATTPIKFYLTTDNSCFQQLLVLCTKTSEYSVLSILQHLTRVSNMSGAPRTPPRTRSPPPVALNAASGIPYGYVPAYLPGSASLVEELDKELMVVLRDGRHLIGVRDSAWDCTTQTICLLIDFIF